MPGQFNNNMYLNPQMGMKPAPVQGGGMQQGMPMGGQGQPMPGGGMQQGMPMGGQGQPMQGGGPQIPPGWAQQGETGGPQMPPGRFGMPILQGGVGGQGQGSNLQPQIDDIMGQIQRAQFNGANPMMIADLQMQLQQLQRQQQESYAVQMANMMRNKPVGSPRIGGGTSFNPQEQQNYQADMWLLQQLMSGGGGGYGPQIG